VPFPGGLLLLVRAVHCGQGSTGDRHEGAPAGGSTAAAARPYRSKPVTSL